ncbi:C40 family peptidase [Deinococcus daejeonensis]|uniref:Peptidase n=1 Tax=Deinococcus daejeonensis TaxID=1007098 RepID=A0ABQ2J420_9DEIO|nr:C40 family peptidase [Deinococcus daejeonensis]GGN39800.1 peptidase [Deinococcus daejeonensis]
MNDFRCLPVCLLLGALLLGGADAQAVFTDATSAPLAVTGGPDSVTVQPGDTAFSLARRAGLSVAELLALNGLSSPELRVGQVLRLRLLPVTYAVQPGDTLYALARRFGVTVDALSAASGLTPGASLRAGQVLTLPAGALAAPLSPTPAPAAAPAGASPFQPVSPAQVTPVLQPVSPMPRSQTQSSPPQVAQVPSGQSLPGQAQAGAPTLAGDWRTAALSLLNTPYVFGGVTRAGTDCSGLVLQVFTPLGVTLPRTSAEQARAGLAVPGDALEAGDLVFFDTEGAGRVSHVGIYLGEDQFISANSYQGRVTVDRLRADRYWGPRFVGARRVLGLNALAPAR